MSPTAGVANHNLIWIYTGSLDSDLDAATWLEAVKHLRRLGWKVVLLHAGEPELTEIGGVGVMSIPKPDVYLVRQAIFHMRVLREVFRRWQTTDIVLFHQMSAPWLLPLRFLRIVSVQRKPLIIMDTRTAPMIPRELATRRDRARTAFDNAVNRIANYLADGQTAITMRMAALMRIPERQLIGVWPSGVNLDLFKDARQERDWERAGEEVHIIYVGALHRPRNLMNFCKAILSANEKQRRFVFTMVGDGSEREDLQTIADSTHGEIRVLPPVPHRQVPSLLAGAHIGVLPFPDQERFRVSSPIKLFEYMASGMPILATHISCHTDVVGDGRYAFWSYGEDVDSLALALEEVWELRDSLQERGRMAADAANLWTWESSAAKLSSALLQRLDRHAPGTLPLPVE